MTAAPADILIPVKGLAAAKSRLRGAADRGLGDPAAHARLTLALARDTVAAARSAYWVRDVVVVSSDPEVTSVLTADGVEVLSEGPRPGLNNALEHGAHELRARHRERRSPPAVLAALQADLPALRPAELDEALQAAAALFAGGRDRLPASVIDRAFCADAAGEGTTLLVCGPHSRLRPRFGVASAAAHAADGAVALTGLWPGLRRDVDTVADLLAASALGLGPATSRQTAGAWPLDPVAGR